MNAKRVNGAAGVILAALTQHRTATGIALALESVGLLMTPETAADMASLSTDAVSVAEQAVAELRREHEESARLRARVAELEKREAVVAEFVSDRAGYITAINNCHPGNAHDYNRWQGHAESRRQLAGQLGLPVAWPPEYGQDVSPEAAKSADKLTALLAPTQALREDEPAAKCRCDEPGADPYECEADDCTGEFSELNPFGGGPVQGHDAKVSRTCETCGWKTSVWHVADGSAEEELHGHTVRVHGGQPVAGAS